MGETLKEYCLHQGREALLAQWHPEKNPGLDPENLSSGSRKKVWWRCEQGHEWLSAPETRVGKHAGCPYCAGKQVAPGKDLAALYPHLAGQWHPQRNDGRTPDQYLPGSNKLAWWRCGAGHEWRATVKSRTQGAGCPVCAGKVVIPGENDLGTLAPILARQWHPEKNGPLRPDQMACGSIRRVWWHCERGHEWQAEIRSRVMGSGCPVCLGKTVVSGENDLQTHAPELASQWDREKNAPLGPEQVSVYSNRRVWWRCSLGHTWQCAVSARTSGRSGCPYCSGKKVLAGFNDLKTVQPLVAAQWHPTLNAPLEPTMVTAGSGKRVWWQCTDGHQWKSVIYSRTGAGKCGCPYCAGKR